MSPQLCPRQRKFIFSISIVACLSLYCLYNISLVEKILKHFYKDIRPDFLSDVAALEGVLIGVATPIGLQVVIWAADRYRDHEIAQFFIKEPLYRLQYGLILPNIAIAILLRFLNVLNYTTIWYMSLTIIYIWLLINIYIFYRFVKIVEQYTTNTDKVILQKLKESVKNILTK